MVIEQQNTYPLESGLKNLGIGTTKPDVGKHTSKFSGSPVLTPPSAMVSVTALPTPPFSPDIDSSPSDYPIAAAGTHADRTHQNLNVIQGAEPLASNDTLQQEPSPNLPQPNPHQPLQQFHHFPLLPPELRLKIWSVFPPHLCNFLSSFPAKNPHARDLSFLPRTVELHTRRTHYADWPEHHGGAPRWKSSSRNPAALSVCIESRLAAQEFYTAALPLVAAAPAFSAAGEPERRRQGRATDNSSRVLYVNLEHDTVALLGDLHFERLNKLLEWFREQEESDRRKKGHARGLRRLAMSTAPWAHDVGAATLRAFSRTVFRDIDEFVLFMYAEATPPLQWGGGRCELEEISAAEDYYRRFVVGRGKQFVDPVNGGWMRVGRKEMRIADIRFEEGW